MSLKMLRDCFAVCYGVGLIFMGAALLRMLVALITETEISSFYTVLFLYSGLFLLGIILCTLGSFLSKIYQMRVASGDYDQELQESINKRRGREIQELRKKIKRSTSQ